MTTANAVARRVGKRLLSSPNLVVTATLIEQGPGGFGPFGEFELGIVTTTPDVPVVSSPITGEERQVLPEGIRSRDVRTFWTRRAVEPVIEGDAGHGGDHFLFDGKTWLIFQVENWGGLYEAKAVRKEGSG